MSIDQLQEKIRKLRNPSMVGIDPILSKIPTFIKEEAYQKCGGTLEGAAEAYRVFCYGILDALRKLVPAAKIQTGCFEALGHDGVKAMEDVIRHAKKCGYYVIMDTMRGDIDCTAEALAQSYFSGVEVEGATYLPYPCDAVMTNSYLGSDGIMPFVRFCKKDKNVFLLAKTSNKSSREVQNLVSGDRVVYQVILDLAMRWSIDMFGKSGYSEIGVTMSGNHPKILQSMRAKYDKLFFIVCGYGAQGANARDVQYAFDRLGHGAIVCSGRHLLYAYERAEEDERSYQQCAVNAAVRMRDNILSYINFI